MIGGERGRRLGLGQSGGNERRAYDLNAFGVGFLLNFFIKEDDLSVF